MAVAAGNAPKSSTVILQIMQMTNAVDITPTNFACTLTGTFDAGDLTNVTLSRNNTPDLAGSPQTIVSSGATGDTGPHAYNFANSNLQTSPHVRYFIVSAVIAAGADTGHTIQASKLTLTGAGSSVSDLQTTPAGLKTITA